MNDIEWLTRHQRSPVDGIIELTNIVALSSLEVAEAAAGSSVPWQTGFNEPAASDAQPDLFSGPEFNREIEALVTWHVISA